jgi:hypothetical protein
LAEPAPASEADPLSISVEGQDEKIPEVRAPIVQTKVQVILCKYCVYVINVIVMHTLLSVSVHLCIKENILLNRSLGESQR